ncbi:MAG: hypothetical protein WKF42_01885 [Solirubrobacteraceae bacterium]
MRPAPQPTAPPDVMIATALALTESAASSRWRGPDIYDGLWWQWPKPLTAGRRRRQALIQLHARSPLDIRLLYRRRHPLIPKALGMFGSVGLRVHAMRGDERARELATDAFETLDADATAGDRAWGYPWDMQTRWSFYPAGSPNIVVTAFAGSALLEAERVLGRHDLGERARRAARWVLDELWVQPQGFFTYHPGNRANIHNASLLGAGFVHAALPDDPVACERVARAVQRTLAAQRADGAWPYGEAPNLAWVDSFHTGYVLSCLHRLRAVDPAIDAAVARGARYYERFFDADGRASLWPDKRFPEDGHAAGTGLSTLALLVRDDIASRELLARVARRTLDAGIHDGHAVFRRYRWGRTHVQYLRWCDAHVALGLVDAAAAIG